MWIKLLNRIKWIELLRLWWKFLAKVGKPEPEKFTMFYLPNPITPLEFREKLKKICFQENYWEIKYKGQGIGLRRLIEDDKQEHLRYNPKTGKVTGHQEYDFFVAEDKHKKGENVHPLTREVIREIMEEMV